MTYATVIITSWAVFIAVWLIFSFGVKRDIEGSGFSALWSRYFQLRILVAAFAIFVAVRIATGTAHYANAERIYSLEFLPLIAPPPALGWIAAFITVLGVLFAVWARVHLGRNWSSVPSAKEGHELVTSGPYAYVRHPIYTGVILAAFGSALTGTVFGIGVLAIATLVFFLRIGKEERIMCELFPHAYPAYQMRTKRLVPFVW